jgi:DNA polymerase III subunit delta
LKFAIRVPFGRFEMLIVLLGPERFLVAQALKAYIEKYAPDAEGLGDLNLVRLDGARVTPDELTRAVQSMGFLADRRVVVVEGLLSRFGSGKAAGDDDASPAAKADAAPRGRGKSDPGLGEGFAKVFGSVPEACVLILVERGGVAKNNAMLKAASRYGKVEEHLAPRGVALERWLAERCKATGVKITQGAQNALSSTLPDLHMLANEVDKLSLYVGPGGLIDEQVLKQMSFVSKQDDVFEMTSAAARRDTKGALQQLQRLLDGGTAAEGILPVLAWQVRTLIQIRDMLDRKIPDFRMAEAAGLSDFVVRKSVGQARQFSMKKLLLIHSKLLELDHGVKTGRADAELSLDALVVEMCQ